ncbi:hypothetical protein I317_06128 [Kwoniella heveanensis CBS 569]|nr:hypothetical protein I317_06128 [Kwoniella heveanensis CBS 569]
MARTNKRKRTHSPSPEPSSSSSSASSDEQLSPPPMSKRSRIPTGTTTTAESTQKAKPHSDKASHSETAEIEDEDISDDDQSSSASSSDHIIATRPPVSRLAKGKQSASKSTPAFIEEDPKTERGKSMLAHLKSMDEDSLENLLSSRSKPNKRDIIGPPYGAEISKGDDEGKTKNAEVLGGVLTGIEEEEEEEDPEETKALEEQAEDLVNALSAPFEQLQISTVENFNDRIQTVAQCVHTALLPFEGTEIVKSLNAWKDSQTAFARNSTRKWDEAESYMTERKFKLDEIIQKIRDAEKVKAALINSAAKDLEKAQTRQKAEIAKLRAEIVKIKTKQRAKVIKATDQERIKKEINMVMTELLAQQMAS